MNGYDGDRLGGLVEGSWTHSCEYFAQVCDMFVCRYIVIVSLSLTAYLLFGTRSVTLACYLRVVRARACVGSKNAVLHAQTRIVCAGTVMFSSIPKHRSTNILWNDVSHPSFLLHAYRRRRLCFRVLGQHTQWRIPHARSASVRMRTGPNTHESCWLRAVRSTDTTQWIENERPEQDAGCWLLFNEYYYCYYYYTCTTESCNVHFFFRSLD